MKCPIKVTTSVLLVKYQEDSRNFEGRKYDVGDKLGLLEATADFALKRPDLRDRLMEYLKTKVSADEVVEEVEKVIGMNGFALDKE